MMQIYKYKRKGGGGGGLILKWGIWILAQD